jgi:hypothetical protein
VEFETDCKALSVVVQKLDAAASCQRVVKLPAEPIRENGAAVVRNYFGKANPAFADING